MKKVYAYIHTHWDREWYREFEEFRLRLIEVFDEIINALENGELPCFYFDGQTAALEDYLEIYPEKAEKIKKLIKQKKLSIGPFYCSADSLLVSGECLYRNFEIGIEKSKEFGQSDFIGYLADTFGHSKSLPYILKANNIDKACVWRGVGNYKADLEWSGIKTTNLIQGYFQDFLSIENISIEQKAELLKKYLDKISAKSSEYVLLPIGADHLAIPKNLKEQINKLNKIYKDYQIKVSMPFEYFDKITKRQKVEGELLDNSLTFILPGVYSSRLYLKQANAKSQWTLTNIAEPLQALSHYFFNTKNRQNEINYAYKTLIKNHAHDSIYGCSTDEVHKEVMQRYKKVDEVSNGIIKRTIRDLSADNGELSVINLSSYDYTGVIKIETEKELPKWMKAIKIKTKKGFTDKKLYNINQIPVTEDITDINEYLISVKNLKPYSITKITKENISVSNELKAKDNYIENQYIKLEIKNGKITVTDKKNNEKYTDFITILDKADIGDSYNFGPLKGDKSISAKVKSYKLKENNKQRAILQIKYEINIPASSSSKKRTKNFYKHTINVNSVLYNHSEYIEFKVDWINKSKNHLFQIGFNLKNKISKTLNEDLFGTVERTFNPDFDIYKQTPAKRGIELKPNTSPMQRYTIADNFALLSKGNSEYEINKNTLFLTLLRATGIISNSKNSSRGTPAGPPVETPELQCLGQNKADFAIAFTNDVNELYRLSDEFYNSTLTLFTNIEDKQFIKTKNKNIKMSSIYLKNNRLRIRMFNISNKNQTLEIELPYKENIKFLPNEIKNIDFPTI